MGDRDAEAAACLQDSRDGSDRAVQVEDVLEGHERDREICATGSKWKGACVAQDHPLAPRVARHSREGPRSIDADDSVASLVQKSAEPAFPTGYVESKAPRVRTQLEEARPVEVPEEVIVFGRPSEPRPCFGLLFPGVVSAHEISARAVQRIAAELRPRAHHPSTDRTPPAVLPVTPAAAGQGRRTPPPAVVSCSCLLGGDRFYLERSDKAVLEYVDAGVWMVEPEHLGGWKVEVEAA